LSQEERKEQIILLTAVLLVAIVTVM